MLKFVFYLYTNGTNIFRKYIKFTKTTWNGIRTHAHMCGPDFDSGALDHSAIQAYKHWMQPPNITTNLHLCFSLPYSISHQTVFFVQMKQTNSVKIIII